MTHDLQPGGYVTDAGSEVRIGGKHGGKVEIDFDWFEEDACLEAEPWVQDGELMWCCSCCDEDGESHSARLVRIERDGVDPRVPRGV